MTAFAIAYDWCFDYWSAEQKKVIVTALLSKGLDVAYNDFYGGATSQWTYWFNNHMQVNIGGIILASLALMDLYPEMCSELIEYSLRGIEYVLPFYAPDGAWGEGPSYWSYGLTHYARGLASMDCVFGTDFGDADSPGMDQTAFFIYAMHGARYRFNFHDDTPMELLTQKLIHGSHTDMTTLELITCVIVKWKCMIIQAQSSTFYI